MRPIPSLANKTLHYTVDRWSVLHRWGLYPDYVCLQIAAVITLPFDVVKTHRQIELGEADTLKNKHASSTWKIISRLYTEKGITALFAGNLFKTIKYSCWASKISGHFQIFQHFALPYNRVTTSSRNLEKVVNFILVRHEYIFFEIYIYFLKYKVE